MEGFPSRLTTVGCTKRPSAFYMLRALLAILGTAPAPSNVSVAMTVMEHSNSFPEDQADFAEELAAEIRGEGGSQDIDLDGSLSNFN